MQKLFATMAPKRTGPERDALRARVWQARSQGFSYGAIAAQEKIPRSTVQSMIKQISASGNISVQPAGGRPSKLGLRCVVAFLCYIFQMFQRFRYRNALFRLANKHPFWGAKQLAKQLHADMVAALTSRPPGAVIQVQKMMFHHAASLFHAFRCHPCLRGGLFSVC